MNEFNNKDLLTPNEACTLLTVSERWLTRHSYVDEKCRQIMVAAGVKPLFKRYKVGKHTRYSGPDILNSL